MVGKLQQQITREVQARRMAPMSAEQFFVTLVSSCLFPFAARPMISAALGLDSKEFEVLMERRRAELPAFLKSGLRP